MTSRRRRRIALANIALNILAALAIDLSSATAVRGPATAIIIFGTGIAIVPLLSTTDLALNMTLALLTSVAVLICVAQLVTYTQGFTWQPCERYLLVVTAIGSAVSLFSNRSESSER
jgi:peptidoglycan/LPS O-acetylase OafA/YrhL